MMCARFSQWLYVVVGAAIAANGYLVAIAPSRIPGTYGLAVTADMELLLRHRAVMMALIGTLVAVSAFYAMLRPAALTVGGVSIVTYAVLALSADVNDDLRGVAHLDLVLVGLLASAVLLDPQARRRHPVQAESS